MQEMKMINKDFQENLSTLEKYIQFNKESRHSNFREYRDIVYGAIINRGYTLWETYIKDIFCSYFALKKHEFYQRSSIIDKYRLHELPGFLFETAKFDMASESITFQLSKDILAFTSKNMDISEMSKLFRRIDIDLQSKLDSNDELKKAVNGFEVAFENGLLEENKTTQALKRIIQERNLVSHSAHIDAFQSIDILMEWVKYYKLLGRVLYKIVCLEYVKTIDVNKKIIGECKNALQDNILLIDIGEDIIFDLETRLYVYSNETLIDIVVPKSIRVDDKTVSIVIENNKAGIKLETIFEDETKIKKEYKYYLIDVPL